MTVEDPYERFSALLSDGALYKRSSLASGLSGTLPDFIGARGRRCDAYCPFCRAPSVLQLSPMTIEGTGLNISQDHIPFLQVRQRFQWLEFSCARNGSHRSIFSLLLERIRISDAAEKPAYENRLTKIGQHPSHADIAIGRFKDLAKGIEPLDYAELKRAAGLNSHEVPIAAMVYLRRIFERMIASARPKPRKTEALRTLISRGCAWMSAFWH